MSNPAITTIFAADPSAHVFEGRLYVYVSYDQPFTNTHDSMISYHCLSTDDLVSWVDHGQILSLDDVHWALSHMWAIDCNYWRGKYYLVFCAFDRETSTFRTGLAVSERPEGPFADLGIIRGVEWGQDPSLFIDDDTPYLIWGGRGAIFVAELAPDLHSVKVETITDLSGDLDGYEGPFLHKRGDTYYLSYPALDGENWPQRLCYATADRPLGPYRPRGPYIEGYEGNSGTIHGSIVEFGGQWYAFYHSAWVSGLPTSRSMMVDRLDYDNDGAIRAIVPSREGATGSSTTVTTILDASAGETSGARRHGTQVSTSYDGSTGHGCVTGLVRQETGVSVWFDFGGMDPLSPVIHRLSIRYRNDGPSFHGRVLFGSHLFYDGNQNQSYDQYINRGTVFAATAGEWVEIEIGTVPITPGGYRIRLSASHTLDGESEANAVGGIQVDYFAVEVV